MFKNQWKHEVFLVLLQIQVIQVYVTFNMGYMG